MARYCNDAGVGNNVAFTAKEGTVKTWGVKVLPGKTIDRNDEIFVSYGKGYWQTYKAKQGMSENVATLSRMDT